MMQVIRFKELSMKEFPVSCSRLSTKFSDPELRLSKLVLPEPGVPNSTVL